MNFTSRTSRCLCVGALALAAASLAGCSESTETSAFVVRNSAVSTPLSSPVATGAGRFVFLAAENLTGGGADLNGDGDTTDLVAHTARFVDAAPTNIGVAASSAVVVGGEVYLIVEEAADGTNYAGAGTLSDTVLLHWDSTGNTVHLVDTIEVDADFETTVVVDNSLFYVAGATPVGSVSTNLRRVDTSDPQIPVTVNSATASVVNDVNILGVSEGLLFVRGSEVENSAEYNGDGDMLDETILFLLDGTDTNAEILNSGLALEDEESPFDANLISAGDWVAACLVDEAEQGTVSLNDHTDTSFTQPFLPGACLAMTEDTDTDDQVLHWIRYADLLAGNADATGNTGLAGGGRVLVAGTAVATLSNEADATCDLNGDGDLGDHVARWVEATPGATYVTSDTILRAVETSLPGGAMGFSELSDRLVCAVSELGEGMDIDGVASDNALVAWVDPADGASATWTISHPTDGIGTGVSMAPYVGATWMAADSFLGRLPMTYSEIVPNQNLNSNSACSFVQKDSDTVDALPVWADFAGNVLDFDGIGYAVSETAPGVSTSGNFAFFRVDETADNVDWNDDGDLSDLVLFRNPLTSCNPVPMGTSSPGAGVAAQIEAGSGGAFLTSEASSGTDLNDDGDQTDFVLRWFSF